MKRWLKWVKGESHTYGDITISNTHPLKVFGRFILSLWILTVAITGSIGFTASVLESKPESSNNECITVDTPDGAGMDTCDLLVP